MEFYKNDLEGFILGTHGSFTLTNKIRYTCNIKCYKPGIETKREVDLTR